MPFHLFSLLYSLALSVQSGYAKRNGVNLLVSGFNSPLKANGGSGIFLANGRIAETYISGARGSKMIIYDVPRRTRQNPCDFVVTETTEVTDGFQQSGNARASSVDLGQLPDISSFNTLVDDLRGYTFKSVNLDSAHVSEDICSGKSSFCCNFNISIRQDVKITPSYEYR